MQEQHQCKNCGNHFSGKYCNNCGEKFYTENDRKISHLAEEGFHFITHFEGKFFKTLKTILTRPGKLSDDYCTGIRKSYFKPLSFFLLLVVIYLLFPVFEGLNMQLKFHLENEWYGEYAQNRVNELKSRMTDEEISKAFAAKSEKASKFLLIVILPFTALVYWLFTFRKRKHFFDQMVFATEINSFYLMWGFLILPLLLLGILALLELFGLRNIRLTDDPIGIILYAVACLFVGIAAKRFYKVKTFHAILLALLFYFAHYIIVQMIYKFILFFTVINQID